MLASFALSAILVYDSEALHGRGMENSLSSHEKRTIGRAAAGTALAAIGAGMTGYFSWMMSKEGQEFMTSKEGQELLARGVDLGREHPHLVSNMFRQHLLHVSQLT